MFATMENYYKQTGQCLIVDYLSFKKIYGNSHFKNKATFDISQKSL